MSLKLLTEYRRVYIISRSRENESKVKKNLGPVGTKQSFLCFAKKNFNREPFLMRTTFFARQNCLTVTRVQRYRFRRESLGAYYFL